MEINMLAFGIAKDIVGGSQLQLLVKNDMTVAELKQLLAKQYPPFSDLASLMIAVNNEYAQDNTVLKSTDEVALIPPVSGG